jgi:2-dehydropantoate 2-reductase
MLLHNGMGTIEQVRAMFPNNPLVAAITSYGAFKPDINTLIETGLGQTDLGWIGNVDTALKQSIEPILSTLLPPSNWHQDISLALWKKLAINAVINPHTAIHGIKNGKLADKEYTVSVTNACDENATVMRALNYAIDSAELFKNVQQVISATANNYSSMHQDVRFERQTEIEFINGYIISKATDLNIKVPHNQRLVEQIRQLG